LLQPVPMTSISTGCNMCRYFWPRPLARFPVVLMASRKQTDCKCIDPLESILLLDLCFSMKNVFLMI
jgi:hypothetical protein